MSMQPCAIPPYATMLDAYQLAHAEELRAMIADLPLRRGSYVLDMACGAGRYSCWLAERIGPQGRVVAVDINSAFLAEAREAAAAARLSERISFQQGDIAGLPFDNDRFDLVWCAQSMYTLPDPLAALRELQRVVRSGGTVAIFENDIFHQILLPWPADLELAVRQAQLQSLAQSSPVPDYFFSTRRLRAAFREVGLGRCRLTAYTSVRHAPLSVDEQVFLREYMHDIWVRARAFLDATLLARFEALIDPVSPTYLLDDPDLWVTYINVLACGVKSTA